jgi:3-deoxy-D-manno-octulosonate 8-phosphate phosphatase (KDO 8-P phosphatase)
LKQSPDLIDRARRVKLILMDADGVLTDGKIIFLSGASEAKMFDSKDGVGIKLAQRAGLKTGVISGRESEALQRRCEELGMDEIHQRVFEKLSAYEEIIARLGLTDEECCFIGDDLVDAPVLKRVGLPVTVADGHPALEPIVAYVTERAGGSAAVREVVDIIIKAQGKWDKVVGRYI